MAVQMAKSHSASALRLHPPPRRIPSLLLLRLRPLSVDSPGPSIGLFHPFPPLLHQHMRIYSHVTASANSNHFGQALPTIMFPIRMHHSNKRRFTVEANMLCGLGLLFHGWACIRPTHPVRQNYAKCPTSIGSQAPLWRCPSAGRRHRRVRPASTTGPILLIFDGNHSCNAAPCFT